MECLLVAKMPDGPEWLYEIKLDGYRAVAIKSDLQDVVLFSRRKNSLNSRFPFVVKALQDLPVGTVVDGEVVALNESGRPDFNLLQNFRSHSSRIHYYIFDLLCYRNRDLTRLPLIERRALLKSLVTIRDKRIRISDYIEASASSIMVGAIRAQQLEGIVAKRKDSLYEPGQRSGAWIKYRVNIGQEFVIGGYIPGPHGLDSIIVGYYRSEQLIYVARIRNGLVPASRRTVFEKLLPLVTAKCPFANLPETRRSRWGESLNAEKMKECVWVQPELVAQVEFLEWTDADHLRHARFVGLRDDKEARTVTKEQQGES